MTQCEIAYTQLPDLLAHVNQMSYDYLDGHGIDFEPYETFLSASETSEWLKAWTGNAEATSDALRVFGQDGSGGYAAFWAVDPEKSILDQPVVFLGSEGETTVVASNFSDYLWLLARNHGAAETCLFACDEASRNDAFATFAAEHATTKQRPPTIILADARKAHPEFEGWINNLCR